MTRYARWTRFGPYPELMGRGKDWAIPTAPIDVPQAQFIPPFLPPGSDSLQLYPYYTMRPRPVPLRVQQPRFGGGYGAVFEPSSESASWLSANPGLALGGFMAALIVGYYFVWPRVVGERAALAY